ncbi:MAG: adenylate/guanylate cyclase domain-containing protein [Betaproteobacteria bacterium]|nr:adenylate/guanylate cyclase domain-containing protein [Betaproteobacteria bacterium]
MASPPTRYARSHAGYVAYQTFGEGPRDILFVANWASNLDAMWDEPSLAHYFHRLARAGRVICFDKRGSGVSDPVPLASLPTLEDWMDDARVVLDAAGSGQAAVVGDTEGGPMAMLFAATWPSRVSALVLVNSFARWRRAPDYPIGMPDYTAEKLISLYGQHWGQDPAMLGLTAPTIADDPRMREWFVRYQRLAMPPGASTRMYGWVTQLDVRSVLPAISAPTLVIHRAENRHYRVEYGRYLAEHIPDALYVELPGADCFPFHTAESDRVLDEIHGFLTGERESPPSDRELSTVLFTDVVGSTDLAARFGDARWLELRAAHNDVVRRNLLAFHGREVATTGDGFLATFDGPARAVHCAVRIRDAVRELGLEIRAGLHTGEIERRDHDIGGLGVHIAARVMAAAQCGEVLVSGTVADLVIGSGIVFRDRAAVELKGVPGTWRLLEVARLP